MGKKNPAKIFIIHSEENSLYESGRSRTLFFKDARKKRGGLFVIGSAAAAVLLGIVIGVYFFFQSSTAYWTVEKLAGTPIVGSEELTESGMLKVGDWLETDEKSRARLKVGIIGEVDVQPKSRLKLVETTPTEHRISLERGKINAAIWAPPRLFFVETPSATAIDLGCMYTLEVAEDGSGILKVTAGWVALQSGDVESLIPADAVCKTKKSYGPGTPYFEDASKEFKAALYEFDFSKEKKEALSVILKESRKEDAISLWHILSKVQNKERERTYIRLTELVEILEGITFEGIMNGNQEMMDVLWESLGYGSRSLWNYL
ncbi:MAG: hypothetical protein A2V93_05425 [Ignavibacteria bacterium RBG_16_34_14]|nr:MAG: hypothetical protein A2V93_05425 [Ignavibacteria bacterium RBG_16_34_14]